MNWDGCGGIDEEGSVGFLNGNSGWERGGEDIASVVGNIVWSGSNILDVGISNWIESEVGVMGVFGVVDAGEIEVVGSIFKALWLIGAWIVGDDCNH